MSTPLTVRAPGAGDDAEGAEVRITAQRLADGRIEFALQEREADGEWSERLLPRVRFFPATASVGRWLVSTPLTVSLPESEVSPDRAALVALYDATEGASWITRTNWLSDRPLGEWFGVTTDSDGRVAALNLWENQLTGPIPAALANLTNLSHLDLEDNQLTGPIPVELGNLTNLSWLALWANQLTGPIPAELGDLTNLVYLGLGGNQLTGPIPAELGNLTNLSDLYLGFNELTGPIPARLGNLSNLESLDLVANQLTGPIPAELGNLTNLLWLLLSFNQLTGSIPAELGDLTNLELLGLGGNELTGAIPAELANLSHLDLEDNQLTGPIPVELGNLTNLSWLALWANQLTGPIPTELGNLTNLSWLALWANQLTGPIPTELGNLTNLVGLFLRGNQLMGCVPVGLRDVAEDNDLGELGLLDCGFEGRSTAIRVGADVRGALDYDGDIDYFRFRALRGQIYQIDVALGTLDDSIVSLYDADGSFLDSNDDFGDTFASRLFWEAPSSGERYVAVEGYGTGTYTLTVSLITDDHANPEGRATEIRVGADVRGALDYDGDIDYFRIFARRGRSYQIDVALGTLDDSIVSLYAADGSFLDTNDDHDYEDTFASRLYWEAPSSGERYVAVKGRTGTYTLTVSLDDHGNDFESATRIAIRATVAIELENYEDLDVLVFRARPGTEYVLSLNWESYSFRENYTEHPLLAVFDTDGTEHTRLVGYDFSRISVPSIDLHWQAVTGGDYYIVIGDGNTDGTAAFSVTTVR